MKFLSISPTQTAFRILTQLLVAITLVTINTQGAWKEYENFTKLPVEKQALRQLQSIQHFLSSQEDTTSSLASKLGDYATALIKQISENKQENPQLNQELITLIKSSGPSLKTVISFEKFHFIPKELRKIQEGQVKGSEQNYMMQDIGVLDYYIWSLLANAGVTAAYKAGLEPAFWNPGIVLGQLYEAKNQLHLNKEQSTLFIKSFTSSSNKEVIKALAADKIYLNFKLWRNILLERNGLDIPLIPFLQEHGVVLDGDGDFQMALNKLPLMINNQEK